MSPDIIDIVTILLYQYPFELFGAEPRGACTQRTRDSNSTQMKVKYVHGLHIFHRIALYPAVTE
ncbi:hypothetical protein CVT25_015674 [Psilocybe cyanescens]|uniref:Uncharacterized protein n=1 Tax=Psilocybe cyanescens TaxID=93625 RepID=A0A409WSJ1_PSICY|nr:hypothetical protein CVT25_015674 [Psilocybe cyanescens]